MTKLSKDQLDVLLEYIDARIDERIQDAFGRDSGPEYLKVYAIKGDLFGRLVDPNL